MDYARCRSQPRKNIVNWQYYNDHFKFEHAKPLPLEQPPSLYRNEFKSNVPNRSFMVQTRKTVSEKRSKGRKNVCGRVIEGLDQYCSTSSMHGLKYAGEKRYSIAERIFWLIAFLIAVCMAFYYISQLYINYNRSPVIVSYSPQMQSVQNIPFPAITICNLNIAAKSRAEHITNYGSEVEKLVLADMCESNATNYKNPGNITWAIMEGIILNITQRCSEMVVGCRWQGRTHECLQLLDSVITDDGYCCTFNRLPSSVVYKQYTEKKATKVHDHLIEWYPETGYPSDSPDDAYPYRAFGRGVQQGLTLVLDCAVDEYFCSTASSFGFKLLFHTPRESPKIKELGFFIRPGVEARISVDVDVEGADDSIADMEARKRKCLFALERPLRYFTIYSAKNCLLECESNYTEICGCIPYFLPRSSNATICGRTNAACIDRAKFVIERYGKEKLACNCLPGCSQISYYPGTISQGRLLDKNNITYTEFLGNYTQRYFADNMVVIHTFFSVDRFQIRVKSAMYTFSAFLSNTGGLLGLFMGFSFLTVVEIFYFLFVRGPCVWVQNRRNKRGRKQQIFYTYN